jgi:DNA replication protein DnaC
MHIEQTLSQLRTLRLSHMARSMEERIQKGEHKQLTCDEFLGLLVEEEYHARKNRKLSRLIGRANFKSEGACLENVKYRPERGFLKGDLNSFRSPAWVDAHRNVLLIGPTGAGKTYIAEAIALEACKMGYSANKVSYKRLLEEMRNARGTGQYLKYLDRLAACQVLLLDDFGIGTITVEECADLMDVLEERVQKSSTLVTSQYPVELWHTRIPDPTVADAICDRLLGGAIVLNLKGESLRREEEIVDQNDRK